MNTHRQLTKDQLTAYAAYLRAEERSPGTIENYLRHVGAFCRLGWETAPVTGAGRRVESPPALSRLRPGERQRHAGGAERLLPLLGPGGLPGEVSQNPAPPVPGYEPGADPPGVRAAPCRQPSLAARSGCGPADGNHLRHRHPGQRGEVYHRGSGPSGGESRHLVEGQDPHDFDSFETLPKALEIRQGAKKPPPVRFFSPEAEKVYRAAKSGRS